MLDARYSFVKVAFLFLSISLGGRTLPGDLRHRERNTTITAATAMHTPAPGSLHAREDDIPVRRPSSTSKTPTEDAAFLVLALVFDPPTSAATVPVLAPWATALLVVISPRWNNQTSLG